MLYLLARSTDPQVLESASSGGFVREFFAELLRSGQVKQVCLVAAGTSATNLRPRIWLSQSPEEVLYTRSTSSVYYPTNPLPVLQGAREKTAATLLACHQAQVRQAGCRPHCVVELLCKLAPKRQWTVQQLALLGLLPRDVEDMAYRYGEFPGQLTVWNSDQVVRQTSFKLSWPDEDRAMFPSFCAQCRIPHAEGDLVCGDAWRLPQSRGHTLVNIRNPSYEATVFRLQQLGRLEIIPITEADWFHNNQRFLACKAIR